MTTHSSLLTWRTPWTEEPGGLSPRGRKESDTIGVTQRALNSLCYVAESIFPGEFPNFFFFLSTNEHNFISGPPILFYSYSLQFCS